jgi:hypothetical protein
MDEIVQVAIDFSSVQGQVLISERMVKSKKYI